MTQELVQGKKLDVEESDDEVQAHLNSIRKALSEPISSLDSLLELLHAPLDVLKRPLGSHQTAKYTWKRFTGHEPSTAARNAVLRAAWLVDVQTAIITRIAVDWSEILQAEGLWQALLNAWFCAKNQQQSSSSSLVQVTESESQERDTTTGSVQLATLRNLSTFLSQKPQHESVTQVLKAVLSELPQVLDLSLIAAAAAKESGVARATLTWEEAVRNLCALRARVANWTQGDVTKQWERSPHAELLGMQLERLVEVSSKNSLSPKGAVSTLITKLLRTGHLTADSTLWPAVLAAILQRAQPIWPARYSAAWRQAIRGLSRSDAVAFLHNLLSVIDQRLSTHGAPLYTAAELRSSTEGEQFLHAEATEARRAARAILELFVFPRELTCSEASSDSEDDEEITNELLTDLAYGSSARRGAGGTWRPATALVLSQLAHKIGRASKLADKAIEVWGDAKRIPRDAFERSLYLSTLVLTLPLPTPHTPALLNGVSAHLEHLDPAVRRMGMLVAELVSAKAAAASTAPEGETSRPLSFGVSIWQGVGEGKSEVRALRKVHVHEADFEDGPGPTAAQRLALLPREVAVVSSPLPLAHRPDRKAPKTRKLPQRHPPASPSEPSISFLEAPLHPTPRRGGALITELNSSASASSHATPMSGELQALVSRESESEESTSSESDSSESDEGEALAGGLEGLGLGKDDIASVQAAAAGGQLGKDEEQFGLGVPKKQRKRTPVYIGDLAPLLRDNERDANRMGLKFAETLLRRKRGWGGEVDENAVDLSYALCGMQNNFSLKHFEDRRVAALSAVIVASPRLAAPAVIEQYFHHQYSITQRVAILIALAMSARELAGLAPLPSGADGHAVQIAAEDLAKAAVGRAKAEGEARVPAIARQKALSLGKSGKAVASTSHATLAGAVVRPQEHYADLAPTIFLMPLINGLWTAMDEAGARARVAAGTGTLLSPALVARLLDTLSVLAHAARHASSFLAVVVPESLELVLGIARRPLAHADDGAPHDDGRSAVAGAAASLALVILDATWELDGGRTLLRHNAALVLDLKDWAEAVFTLEDAKGGVAAAMGRAGRTSAAVLLRIHEIREVGTQR